ncbi:hypothetical protein E2605_14875 [Dysgonomonas capnocytophagoides]|uniref:Uncharacterized protein n=1 Tax=Dysgonomonas capnocytophagoides TaxID=45254 RepID=A0A4Y8KY70_9BACT|nr:hypothetical protein [Dysgonomonas capnocytophagoides]TFD94653.1 hypothetical protein E2605_14875 [Dysgonomonas capnocytophagoides]
MTNDKPQLINKSSLGIPAIKFYHSNNSNMLYLNVEAMKMLSLKVGDRVLMSQDDKDETLFYIFKSKSNKGFKISKASGKSAWPGTFSCKEFTELIYQTFTIQGKKTILSISQKKIIVDGIEVYPMMRISEEV